MMKKIVRFENDLKGVKRNVKREARFIKNNKKLTAGTILFHTLLTIGTGGIWLIVLLISKIKK